MGSADLEWRQEGEDVLQTINSWVRNHATSYGYAGYVDLDGIRDPNDPAQLRPHVTPDGAHFNQLGQMIITDLIPEHSYGVNKDLTNYATLMKVDPYKAPVETTTKKPAVVTTKTPKTGDTSAVAVVI